MAKSWHLKLKFIRKKCSGWSKNFYGAKKKEKQHLLAQIHSLELLKETQDFSNAEMEQWLLLKTRLEEIYREEEAHWHHRAKQKWLE